MDLTGEWLNAQHSVLGAALIEPCLVPKIMQETSERDYQGGCLMVYTAIRKLFLAGETVDPVTVANAVPAELRGFLIQLMEITPTVANVDRYIAICREQSRINSIQDIAHRILATDNSEQMKKLLEEAAGMMVDRSSVKVVTMNDALASFYDRHTKQVQYLTWPIRVLDDYIFSELGDFIILGGYPSSGKSCYALQCAWHWARNYKVGFFSLETSSQKLFDRQMASVANLNMGDIKRNSLSKDDWDKLGSMTVDIVNRNLELIPAAGYTPADVKAMTMQRGYQIIFVDYLQLLQAPGKNRTEQVTAISIALHTMAQSLGVTVVALSQLARHGKDREYPDMSDLRESGQIEQDADLIMLLSLEDKENNKGPRILDIAKNKEGERAKTLLAFDGAHQTFSHQKKDSATLGKFIADGKRARSRHRAQTDAPSDQQLKIMMEGDKQLPF